MDKFILFVLASAGAAFAALVSTDASALGGGAEGRETVQASTPWRADSQARGCRIQMRWQKDYAGQAYLRKVRICA